MKGSREVVEMEDTGEIWYNNDDNLVLVDWQEQQKLDEEEIRRDAIYQEEKERRAGFFARNPDYAKFFNYKGVEK
jgi:hypothetical protein|tara:strand:- start:10132 stop:10356 length:225 start_codon:yes stop_codon:yes gene_type:complete